MSRYWGYSCLTCNVASDEINHGGDLLKRVALEIYPHVRTFYAAIAGVDTGHCSIRVQLEFYSDIIEFLEQHDGHVIRLDDEYGEKSEILDIPKAVSND